MSQGKCRHCFRDGDEDERKGARLSRLGRFPADGAVWLWAASSGFSQGGWLFKSNPVRIKGGMMSATLRSQTPRKSSEGLE